MGHLIVDGYNLARSGALPLEGEPGSAEERGALCSLLSAYARKKGFRLTVVFDGRGSGSPKRTRQAFKGGTAVYSSRSETADDVIRDLARGAPAGTIAVTSDRGLAGTLPPPNRSCRLLRGICHTPFRRLGRGNQGRPRGRAPLRRHGPKEGRGAPAEKTGTKEGPPPAEAMTPCRGSVSARRACSPDRPAGGGCSPGGCRSPEKRSEGKG